jgi:DNA-binding SARP family transcriptional activator
LNPSHTSGSSDGGVPSESGCVDPLRVKLLGGFRVERIGAARPVVWQRRSAKKLTKLVAAHPRHSLHREEILEALWPDVPTKPALNRFGQALHAARRAFEPELRPRQGSAYLRLKDSMLSLETEHVAIDADRFQQLAESALAGASEEAYESALAAYGGELLPEDRYDEWCAERRAFLAELQIRLLVELADALRERGAQSAAADRLREVLRYDPTREDVHRRLIVLYAAMGTRNEAVRQFQTCREALQRELGLVPGESTRAVYDEILADRIPTRVDAPASDQVAIKSSRAAATGPSRDAPTIARASVIQQVREKFRRAGQREPVTPRATNDVASRTTQTTRAGQSPGRRRARPARSASGYLIFRIGWVTAIVIAALVFLVGLFSGSDSSRQTAEVASAPPPAPVVGETEGKAQKTKTAGPQNDRSPRAKEQRLVDSHSSSGIPRDSATEPVDAVEGAPVVPPQPSPQPKPTPSPQPKPTPSPPQVPASSQPAPSEPVQTPVIVANNNTDSP